MPSGVVKTQEDEHKWEKAKQIAKDQGHGGNYAYIMGVYKKMKPDGLNKKARMTQKVASVWQQRQADKIRTSLRAKVNNDLNRKGLDGQGTFQRKGQALTAISKVLEKHGIEFASVITADLLSGSEGRRLFDVAFSNKSNPHDPVLIENSVISFSWYERESGRLEITAYLS
jgi:hypothetical protein